MITRQLAIITIFVGFVIGQPVVAEFKYLQSDPIGLAAKTPTTVNFVTEIPNNPKLLKQSVNLLRQTPQGTKIVGNLHDDGLSGDRFANDNLYTLQVKLDEADAGQIVFQASAAYKAVLKRDLSTPYALSVYPAAEQILYLTPPSHSPSALRFALNKVDDVTFNCRTTGTNSPPAVLELWELDANGKRTSPSLGQLRDDGQNGDLTAGDSLYSGTFEVGTGVKGDKRYQATAVYQGRVVASPVAALSVTHHPIGPAVIDPAEAIQDPLTGLEFAPGELLVKFQAGLTPQQIDSVLQPLNATVIGSLPEIGVLEVRVPNAGDSNGLRQALGKIQVLPQTVFVEPVGMLYAASASADKPCDSVDDTNCDLGPIMVRANEVWPTYEGAGTIVAVVDTGVSIDPDDSDLIDGVITGYNVLNPSSPNTQDSTGHGTSVARIIAARRNDSGITGIAPSAKIYPVKITESSLVSWPNVATGITEAAKKARVINLSIEDKPGSFYDVNNQVAKATYNATFENAEKQGALVVGIASNTPKDTCIVGRLAKLISDNGGIVVGATDASEALWNGGVAGSGFGSCVDIAALGKNVCTGLDPSDPNKCILEDGTSFAAPQVSGAAALLFSQNPNRTVADVKQRLKIFSKPLGNQFCPGQAGPCAGRLDVFSALVSGEILSGKMWTTPVLSTIDFPNARGTSINALNNKGQSVGIYFSATNSKHGFVYDGNTFTTVDYPGAYSTELTGINDNGQMTGYYALAANAANHGFVYDGSQFRTIDVPNSTSTVVTGINKAGVIVGYFSGNSVSGTSGFELDGSTFTTIDYPGASLTMVTGINNTGQMVGTYLLPSEDSSVVRHGFLYTGNIFTRIDFPNAMRTEAYGLNDHGQIVGSYALAIGKDFGFVYNPGGAFTTKEGPLALYTYLKGINNVGQEVGWYFSGENFVGHGLGQQDVSATDNASQASVQPNDVKPGTKAKFMWNPSDPLQTRFQFKMMVNCVHVDPPNLPNKPYVELEASVVADDYFEFWFNNHYQSNYLLEEHQSPTFPNQGIPKVFNITEFINGENIIEIRANDGGCLLENGECPDKRDVGFPYQRSFNAVFFDGSIKFGSSASSSQQSKCVF
jgi:subtilisin family serine protease